MSNKIPNDKNSKQTVILSESEESIGNIVIDPSAMPQDDDNK